MTSKNGFVKRYSFYYDQLKTAQRHFSMNPKNQITQDVVIINELGLHARAAAKIAALAQHAQADVWLEKESERVDAKSVIDILSVCCPKGTQVRLIVEASSDQDILQEIVRLIENGFGE